MESNWSLGDFLTLVGTLGAATIAAIGSWLAARSARRAKKELLTSNGKTIGKTIEGIDAKVDTNTSTLWEVRASVRGLEGEVRNICSRLERVEQRTDVHMNSSHKDAHEHREGGH